MTATGLVITGASGQLGRRTAELVLEQRGFASLILVTRRPAALRDLAAQGADVRFGNFDEPESLPSAFAGAERILLLSATDLERRVEQHQSAIDAAVAAGANHVIYTSCPSPEPPNPAAIAPSHHATEKALEQSGLAWTVLRNSLYGEYQTADAARALASGKLEHNQGSGQIAYVSREDCAAVAAAVLTTAGHDGRLYDVTGPQLFSAVDLAALYGCIGGREIAVVELDDPTFFNSMTGGDSNDHLRYGAQLVTSLGRSIREGYMASCTGTVAEIAGRPARRLADVLRALLSSEK